VIRFAWIIRLKHYVIWFEISDFIMQIFALISIQNTCESFKSMKRSLIPLHFSYIVLSSLLISPFNRYQGLHNVARWQGIDPVDIRLILFAGKPLSRRHPTKIQWERFIGIQDGVFYVGL